MAGGVSLRGKAVAGVGSTQLGFMGAYGKSQGKKRRFSVFTKPELCEPRRGAAHGELRVGYTNTSLPRLTQPSESH